MFDRMSLKNRAERVISETSPSPYAVTFVFLLLEAVVNFLIGKLNEPLYFWKFDISFRALPAF